MLSVPAGTIAVLILVGLIAGTFANRAIDRLPLQKSILWPIARHCPRCYARLPWWNSIPIVGWILAWGRCRACHHSFPWRSMLVESLAAVLLLGLYQLYVARTGPWIFPMSNLFFSEQHLFALFIYHALFCWFLLVATFIDWEWMIIPDSITVPGMLVGIGLGTFWQLELHPIPLWMPTPHTTLIEPGTAERWFGTGLAADWLDSLAPWINEHWKQNWNRWLGFLTGVVGLIIGGLVIWIVRQVCFWTLGQEAFGFGDVTLLAMIGAFLGWQATLIVFFLSSIPALVVAVPQWVFTRQNVLSFGPYLCLAAVYVIFRWRDIWDGVFPIFDSFQFLMLQLAAMLFFLAMFTGMIRWAKQRMLGS